MYHTAIFDVYATSATNELFAYMDRLTAGAKCMYNVANFHIRQLITGLKKDPSERTPNEQGVIDKVESIFRSLMTALQSETENVRPAEKSSRSLLLCRLPKKALSGRTFL